MHRLDNSTFSVFQMTARDDLAGRLREHNTVRTFFDTEEIKEDFINAFSNFMANRCIVRHAGPGFASGHYQEEIRFFLPAHNILLSLMELENVLYVRHSKHVFTFTSLCMVFIERNLPQFGIITELWEEIPFELFESIGHHGDSIALCVAVDQTIGLGRDRESDRLFEEYRQNIIDEKFDTNKQFRINIDPEPFMITDENKEDMNECKLCCGDESLYVCKECKYPMCKECLKHILKSSGECPCCRQVKDFCVHVVHRKVEDKPLIDDLNFDLEGHETTSSRQFKPEEINEEIDAEINAPQENTDPHAHDIQLTGSLNDDELVEPVEPVDEDDDEPEEAEEDDDEYRHEEEDTREHAEDNFTLSLIIHALGEMAERRTSRFHQDVRTGNLFRLRDHFRRNRNNNNDDEHA